MDDYTEIIQPTLNIMAENMKRSMNKLYGMWRRGFDDQTCADNLEIMIGHEQHFYGDIIKETEERVDRLEQEIKDLIDERNKLQSILGKTINLEIPNNVPLCTILKMVNNELKDSRLLISERKDELHDLIEHEKNLCNLLGELHKGLDENDISLLCEKQMKSYHAYVQSLIEEKDRRDSEILELRTNIKLLCSDLELTLSAEPEYSLIYDPKIQPTVSRIKQLRDLHSNLQNQVRETMEGIDTMKNKLEVLWNILEVSSSVRNKFKKYTGYSQIVYDKYYEELDRCQVERRQNIKRFIDKARKDIEYWWEKTMCSEREKDRFTNFHSDCFTEDLLTLHEMEIDDLKSFYSNNEKIFQLLHERKTLWMRMEDLEAKASDPNRYKNRGGQLLNEEKERKTISKKLPEIESILKELVQEYEHKNNKQFTVYGQSVEEMISGDWTKKEEAKEELKSARKRGASNTPFKTPNTAVKPNSTAKKFCPSSNITASSSRRILPLRPNTPANPAKRRLLTELASLPKLTPNGERIKASAKLAIMRKSDKRKSAKRKSSTGKIKNRRVSRGRVSKKNPRSNNDNTATSDSVSYDCFMDYMADRSPCRSSLMIPNSKENNKPAKLRKPQATPSTPMALRASRIQSNKSTITHLRSPSPATNKKFTTTNLPLMI